MMTYKTKTYLLQEKPEGTEVVKEKKLKQTVAGSNQKIVVTKTKYTVNKYVVNQRLQRVYDISFRKLILFSHFFRYIVSHDLLLL
jgi:hypothetical protein